MIEPVNKSVPGPLHFLKDAPLVLLVSFIRWIARWAHLDSGI